MKIFITGGTGFIGKHVADKLAKDGHKLLLLSREARSAHDTIISNLSDIASWVEDVRIFNPDVIIHMAWEGIPDYSKEMSTKNLNYGLDLVSVAARIGCKKIIATGSCWEYERTIGELTETMPTFSSKPFTTAKSVLCTGGLQLAGAYGIDFIWTRLFYVYGPGQKEHSLIPHIINTIKMGKKLEIKTPYSKNDFVHVKDVANAISLLVTKGKSGIYNIGSGHSTEIKEVIDLVYQHVDPGNRFETTIEKPQDLIDFWADISKMNALGWVPKTNIKEGINGL